MKYALTNQKVPIEGLKWPFKAKKQTPYLLLAEG